MNKLFDYLLQGQCTQPARFKMLSDFIEWGKDHGYDEKDCKETWVMLREIYRTLYGEPVFNLSERNQ